MANVVYNNFKAELLRADIDLETAGYVCFVLVGSGYTPDPDAHIDRADLDNEIAGSGYNQGGYALSGITISQDDSGNQGLMDGTDVLLANITFGTDAQAAVLYGSTGTVGDDPLIAYIDFTTGQAVTAGTFQITWAAGGILALT